MADEPPSQEVEEAAAAALSQLTGEEATPVPAGRSKKKASMKLFEDIQREQWVLSESLLAFNVLEFDLLMSQGQARPLSESAVEMRVQSFKAQMPEKPYEVTVWRSDPAGRSTQGDNHSSPPPPSQEARTSCWLASMVPRRS